MRSSSPQMIKMTNQQKDFQEITVQSATVVDKQEENWQRFGVRWVVVGWAGIALLAGYISLLLSDRPALRDSVGIILTAAILPLTIFGVPGRWWTAILRFSHWATASLLIRSGMALLPIMGCTLWFFWLNRPINTLCDVWRGQCRFGVIAFENRLPVGTTFDPTWGELMSELLGQKLSEAADITWTCLTCPQVSPTADFIVEGQLTAQNPASALVRIIGADGNYHSQPISITVAYTLSEEGLIALSNELTLALMPHLGIPVNNTTKFAVRKTPTANPLAMQLNNEGVSFYQQEQLLDATAKFSAALQLDADYSTAHANLGALLAAQGQDEAALPHYQRAVEGLPNYPVYAYNLGVLYARLGQYPEAAAKLQQAINLDAKYVEAYNELGNVYLAQQQWRRAQWPLAEGVEQEGQFAPLHKNLGRLALAQNRIAAAVDALQTALNLEVAHLLQRTTPVAWNTTEALTATNELSSVYDAIDYLAEPTYALLLRRDGAQETIKLLIDAHRKQDDVMTACTLVQAYWILDPNQISPWAPAVTEQASQLGCR